MSSKLKIGIAGYGIVGKRRRQFIDSNSYAQVIAVCDRKFEKSGQMEDGTYFFANLQSMINEVKLDAVFVCLTNDIAPKATIYCLENGIHVFCEKPPGRTVEDVEQVILTEKKFPKLKLMYGFNHRYHESVKEALKIVKEKSLGEIINMRGIYGKSKILSFESDWRTKREIAGGGILLDQGIHMLDLMRLFAGEFTKIYSFVHNYFWQHDVEDNAYSLMKTDNNIVAMLHSSATQWRHKFQLEVTLQKGQLILSGILSGTKSYGAETLTIVYPHENDCGDPKEVTIRYNNDPSWNDEVSDFIKCILTDCPISSGSSEEALKTMQLVYNIYSSDSKWKEKYSIF
ncbi:Gfo/Idh/MocA family protein [Fluviispira sanaruensis]|uniref:Gfo/Idh/MocA family oxidoreductase n=1 Tax=Fluviispira sanaruensis TaxID=2493639 RepID=A0A4P2VMQ3_FLUSA|nr:Gfo/Idh/MocA family oxidoreductase [Fluviispira sanaruensis]BBH54068.1 gfo/Idh/MocA family oxidoreductase [Fluviispira sanaruensis]